MALPAFGIMRLKGQPASGSFTQIRTTDTAYVDFYPDISGVAHSTPITVTVTGPGNLYVQPAAPLWYATQGSPNTWYRRELMNMCKLVVTGAANNAVITIRASWSGGSTTRYFICKTNRTAITKQIGPRTRVGWGGLQIANELGGSAGNWAILSQTLNGSGVTMFDIWPNNHALTWADSAAGHTAGNYGSLGSGAPNYGKNAAPVVGGNYVVTLRNTTDNLPDCVVTFQCLTNILSVAPNPGIDYNTTSSGTWLNQFADTWYREWCFGDVVACEDGNYNPNSVTTNLVTDTTNSKRSIDPNTNIGPLNTTDGPYAPNGWVWDGRAFNQGFLTITAVRPHGAIMGKVTFDTRGVNTTNVPQGYMGTRYSWMDFTTGTYAWQNLGAGQNGFWSWVVVDNSVTTGLTVSPNDKTSYVFFLRNFVNGDIAGPTGDSSINITAQEGQSIGNLSYNIGEGDVLNTFYYSTADDGHSQYRWNIALNKNSQSYSTAHPDYMQASATGNLTRLNAISATTYPMDFLGNRWMKGIVGQSGGNDLPSAQGFNIGSVFQSCQANSLGVWRIFGNAMTIDFQAAIGISNCGPNCYVRNNDIVFCTYSNNFPADPGIGPGAIALLEYTGTTNGLTSAATLDYNYIANSAASTQGWYNQTGGAFRNSPTPTVAHNVLTANLALSAAYNSTLLSAGPGSGFQTRQAIEDALVPKAGSIMTPAGDPTLARNVGSGTTSTINARTWIWDTTLTPGMPS